MGAFATKNVGTSKTVTVSGLVADRGRCGELLLHPADDDRGHHGGHADRHGHHRQQQGLRRHHRRDPRHHQCRTGGRGLGRPGDARYQQCRGDLRLAGHRHGQDRDGLRIDAQRRRRRELRPRPADDDRGHHPRTLTVTGITASNKVYDGTTDATLDTTGIALAGVVAGDDVTLDDSAVHGQLRHQGRRHGQDRDDHRPDADAAPTPTSTFSSPTTTADITAATVTVTGITASDKVYDGTTDATLDTTNATAGGLRRGG